MTLTIHQAVFGDMKGAHNVIAASPELPAVLLQRLEDFTDRILPDGITWKSYVNGFPLENYYILTRTFIDPHASRPGMVRTHALLIDLNSIGRLANLSKLIDLLPQHPSQAIIEVNTLFWEEERGETVVESQTDLPAGYHGVVAGLIANEIPVWIGRGGFENIICRLWQNLWEEARRSLNFRMSTSPRDLAEQPATLVCTLPELRVNWGDAYLVDSTQVLSTLSASEALLMNLPEGNALAEMRKRVKLNFCDIASLKKLERYLELLAADTEESIFSAARLLGKIAPSPTQAPEEKSILLQRLVEKTKTGGEVAVLRLRNFDVSPFANGSKAVSECVTNQIRLGIENKVEGFEVAKEAFLAEHAWKENACAAILKTFYPWQKQFSFFLWQSWQTDPRLLPFLWKVLPLAGQVERDLISALPHKISNELLDVALDASVQRKWFYLHANLLELSDLPTFEKFRRQTIVDTDEKNLTGIKHLIIAAGEDALMSAALKTKETRLIRFAGEVAAKNPALMHELDSTDPSWRMLWLSYIEHGGDVASGLKEPIFSMHSLMDAVLFGQSIEDALLTSVIPQADLSEYQRRPELWKALSPKVTLLALEVTATYWLHKFLESSAFNPPMEAELEPFVIAAWRDQYLSSPEALLRLYERFSLLNESDFTAWLRLVDPRSLTVETARSLGRLVFKKGWSQSAVRLLDIGSSYPNFALAANECFTLLSLWNRIRLALLTKQARFSEAEWWAAWNEVAVELYPRGVDENHIWENAAGDRSKVKGHSGYEQWTSAFHLLRNGGGGKKITIPGLLHEMRKDFKTNDRLKNLEDVYREHFNQ